MSSDDLRIVSIVEDDLEIGQNLKEFINEHSTTLCCDHHYANCTSALEGIPSCRPDVVVMDIGLPDMTGVDCMNELLPLSPDTKYIMYTVFDTDELLFDALRTGASGYILKDVDFKEIIKAVEEVLEGGGPMSAEIAMKVIRSFKKNAANPKLKELTAHQKKILGFISDGFLNKEIAHQLSIKEGTVKVQISTIYKKLQVNNRVEATRVFKNL